MGLETADFISELVSNWPLSQDLRREGDDHLRLIKRALQNTFPNFNAAVTATPAQLNSLPADSSAVITELKKHIVPKGTIVMWSGLDTEVPTGWAICNGQAVTGFGLIPDLRNRFVVGSSATKPTGQSGGTTTANTSSDGSHVHTVQGTGLTIAQIPSHNHRLWAWDGNAESDVQSCFGFAGEDVAIIGDRAIAGTRRYLATNADGRALTETAGSSQTHTHTTVASEDHSHTVTLNPLYYALTYIIKVTDYVEP